MKLNIAKNWNELTPYQIKKIALLFNSKTNKGLLFDYKILFILMKIRWWQFWKHRRIYTILNNVNLKNLKEHYDWIYKDAGLTTFISVSKKYLPPFNRLTNISIDEFAHADDLILGFYRTKDVEYLYYLCAVLYRENDSYGNRVVFLKDELDRRAKFFNTLSMDSLLAVAMAYKGCKTYITKQFTAVFPVANPRNKTNKIPHSSGFGKLILHLSGQKFGTYNETKQTNLYTFLAELNEQLKRGKN